jgi:acyl dehydratase
MATAMNKLYYEDIEVGAIFAGDPVTIERDTMIAFASEWDNQAMHVDQAGARAMGLGFDDVIASSALTFAAQSKSINPIYAQLHVLPSGIDVKMDFLKPVLAGDELTASLEVLDKRPSRRGGRGLVDTKVELLNQNGNPVMTVQSLFLLKMRPDQAANSPAGVA